MKEFEFIEKKIEEIKEEIKTRKKWAKALVNEYGLKRNEYRKTEITKLYEMAITMVNYNERILNQYQEMLNELKKVKNSER